MRSRESKMISLDLLVNLVLAPVSFLLLVAIREWLHRTSLPRMPNCSRHRVTRARNVPAAMFANRKII